MKTRYIFAASLMLLGLVSCDKFLDTMPDNRAEVNSASKIRALLASGYPANTYLTFNEYMSDNVDNLGDDNPGTNRFMDQIYTWSDVTEEANDSPTNFWGESYLCIAHANQALDAIYDLTGTSSIAEADAIVAAGYGAEMAEALLIRAYNHFMLVNEFCLNYNTQTSSKDLGIPYMEEVELELNPKYERGTVAEVYEKIQRDLELGLKYVSDGYYQIPKYHFNTRAAWAFAARFYLYSEQWDKAVDAATKCVGSEPSSSLRDWQSIGKLERDWDVRSYEFVKSKYAANLLMLTSYSAFGYYFCYPGITKYSHNSYLSFTEVGYAKNVWGNEQTGWRNVSDWYYMSPEWYNGATFDCIAYFKIPYMFEYTDPVARIGYAHAVCPAFTTDEALLNRAEANVMLHNFDAATADINTYIKSVIKPTYFKKDLTTEDIVAFYSAIENGTWDKPTIKKKLNPAFNIGADKGIQESMIQCVLGLKRMDQMAQGLRWFDIKRYGIEIWRRTLQPDPKAGQYDAAFKPYRLDDVLTVDDPRRAMQIPQDVVSAGFKPNPRATDKPAEIVHQPKSLPVSNQ
ncbi:MAG: RagB/SusD family nutrient uptake outer membrane protein [Bacteroidales bacterium]|nr:RagB/SusD family nutrient uptake outer membrane protein [Bacteroidales bacterium]